MFMLLKAKLLYLGKKYFLAFKNAFTLLITLFLTSSLIIKSIVVMAA